METNVSIEEVKVKKPSLFGVITSPSLQFERMKVNAPIGMPLFVLLLIMTVTGALVAYLSLENPIMKTEIMAEFKVPVGFTIGMGAGGALFGGVVTFFLAAAFYKLCMVIMGNDTPYMKLFVIVLYASIISTLGALVNSVIAFAVGGYEPAYTSLAPLFVDNQLLHAIAMNFDIFQIWYYIVLGIGFNMVAGLSKNKAITLVTIVFLFGVGISALGGLISLPGM